MFCLPPGLGSAGERRRQRKLWYAAMHTVWLRNFGWLYVFCAEVYSNRGHSRSDKCPSGLIRCAFGLLRFLSRQCGPRKTYFRSADSHSFFLFLLLMCWRDAMKSNRLFHLPRLIYFSFCDNYCRALRDQIHHMAPDSTFRFIRSHNDWFKPQRNINETY